MRRMGVVALVLILACQTLTAGCSPERKPIRIDPERLKAIRKAAEPPPPDPELSDEAVIAREAAAWARMPTRCIRITCRAVEARWSPTIRPCTKAAQTFYETSACFSRETWRLERIVDRQFRRAAADAPDPATARRISAMRVNWQNRLPDCMLDVRDAGLMGQIESYVCRYNFTIERQMALERLTRDRPPLPPPSPPPADQ